MNKSTQQYGVTRYEEPNDDTSGVMREYTYYGGITVSYIEKDTNILDNQITNTCVLQNMGAINTQPLHAVSVDLFNVGDTVYDLIGKPTTVQSDVTIGKYTIGKLCGGSAQLYTTCFSSAEHFHRHEEASELADYISRKLEWGVVPEGVTLADLQTVKSIIDNGVG